MWYKRTVPHDDKTDEFARRLRRETLRSRLTENAKARRRTAKRYLASYDELAELLEAGRAWAEVTELADWSELQRRRVYELLDGQRPRLAEAGYGNANPKEGTK